MAQKLKKDVEVIQIPVISVQELDSTHERADIQEQVKTIIEIPHAEILQSAETRPSENTNSSFPSIPLVPIQEIDTDHLNLAFPSTDLMKTHLKTHTRSMSTIGRSMTSIGITSTDKLGTARSSSCVTEFNTDLLKNTPKINQSSESAIKLEQLASDPQFLITKIKSSKDRIKGYLSPPASNTSLKNSASPIVSNASLGRSLSPVASNLSIKGNLSPLASNLSINYSKDASTQELKINMISGRSMTLFDNTHQTIKSIVKGAPKGQQEIKGHTMFLANKLFSSDYDISNENENSDVPPLPTHIEKKTTRHSRKNSATKGPQNSTYLPMLSASLAVLSDSVDSKAGNAKTYLESLDTVEVNLDVVNPIDNNRRYSHKEISTHDVFFRSKSFAFGSPEADIPFASTLRRRSPQIVEYNSSKHDSHSNSATVGSSSLSVFESDHLRGRRSTNGMRISTTEKVDNHTSVYSSKTSTSVNNSRRSSSVWLRRPSINNSIRSISVSHQRRRSSSISNQGHFGKSSTELWMILRKNIKKIKTVEFRKQLLATPPVTINIETYDPPRKLSYKRRLSHAPILKRAETGTNLLIVPDVDKKISLFQTDGSLNPNSLLTRTLVRKLSGVFVEMKRLPKDDATKELTNGGRLWKIVKNIVTSNQNSPETNGDPSFAYADDWIESYKRDAEDIISFKDGPKSEYREQRLRLQKGKMGVVKISPNSIPRIKIMMPEIGITATLKKELKIERIDDFETQIESNENQSSKLILLSLEINSFDKEKGKNMFRVVHDTERRISGMNPGERAKYFTYEDLGQEGEENTSDTISLFTNDPEREINIMNLVIEASKLPIPSNLRKRGYLHSRVGKFRLALQDFDKSIQFGSFGINNRSFQLGCVLAQASTLFERK